MEREKALEQEKNEALQREMGLELTLSQREDDYALLREKLDDTRAELSRVTTLALNFEADLMDERELTEKYARMIDDLSGRIDVFTVKLNREKQKTAILEVLARC